MRGSWRGRASGVDGAVARLPGAGLPPAAGRARLLGEPAAARLAVAPLQWLSGPALAYDVALLGSLLLSGLGVYLLVRRATGDRLAAFVAGAYFAAGPQRWIRLAHLHAQVTVFLPLALVALDRFWERRTLRRALVVGLALALQGLSSVYLGAITAAALAVAVLVALFGGLRARELGRLAAGFLLAAAVLYPVTRPYLRMRAFQGQEFTLATVASSAASLPSYAAAGTPAWGWASERLLDPGHPARRAVPGRRGARARRRRARRGAAPLSRGRARRLARGRRLLARAGDGALPLPARARRARARRARALSLRPRALARAGGARGARARRPPPCPRAGGARRDDGRVREPAAAARALRGAVARRPLARRPAGRGRRAAAARSTTRGPCSTASRTGGRW